MGLDKKVKALRTKYLFLYFLIIIPQYGKAATWKRKKNKISTIFAEE